MKKFLKIIGIILLILILIISALVIWKWDLIKSAYVGITANPEDIQTKMDVNQETMQHNIEEYTGISFREPTDEEQAQIASGETTKSEVFEKILNETIESYIKKNETSKNEAVTSTQPKKRTYNDIVADYTSRLYTLKGSYLGRLESLLGQADAEFHALPKEQWTKANRSSIISKYIGVAAGYESSCDSEVNSLLKSLESELKSIGADTSIVSAMKDVYYEEKSLKISYYMSQMK